MGIDLDDADIESEDDLVERIYEHMKNEEARRRERSAERRKSPGQQRAEANAQAAKQFLREIYRKLASAVHPDREADAARRAEKNELMQRINRAYATNDLLTLLDILPKGNEWVYDPNPDGYGPQSYERKERDGGVSMEITRV